MRAATGGGAYSFPANYHKRTNEVHRIQFLGFCTWFTYTVQYALKTYPFLMTQMTPFAFRHVTQNIILYDSVTIIRILTATHYSYD